MMSSRSYRRSSIAPMPVENNGKVILMVYVLVLLFAISAFVVSLVQSSVNGKKENQASQLSGFDNKLVVGRFKRAYDIWNAIATDAMFIVLTKTLMETNSSLAANMPDSATGSNMLLDTYNRLDNHVRQNLRFPEDVRITVMYNDGIVFYDSVLGVNNVFYTADNGALKPVNLYTLGSPLKDHNMLPEVANSIILTDHSDNRISGMALTDPFYRKLVNEGYGFIERISSTFSKPYTYMAHVLLLGIDPATGFINTVTVRIGLPVTPKAI